jgi:hypothetical protein
VLNLVRNGFTIPLGSANGCQSVKCTAEQKAGVLVTEWTVGSYHSADLSAPYRLQFATVIPDGHPSGLGGQAVSLVAEGVIRPHPPVLPNAGNLNIVGVVGVSIPWTPAVSDPYPGPLFLSCRIVTPPTNGTATIETNCSRGTYQSNPGFVGTDTFTYISNDGASDSAPATVAVAVTDGGVDQVCIQNHPVAQFTQTGKQGTLSISFTGNITSHTDKVVKVCPGTKLKYQTSSTQGPVVCKVRNNTTRDSGLLKINDHIKCTDKPAGKDKVGFKVKSGVNQ